MGILALDNLAEGMVLKSDVFDRSGRLLLGCGAELSAKHLRMFRMWGISAVNIAGVDDQTGGIPHVADVDPARLTQVENELRSLFRNSDLSSPAMGELFRLCLLRKVRNETR